MGRPGNSCSQLKWAEPGNNNKSGPGPEINLINGAGPQLKIVQITIIKVHLIINQQQIHISDN